MKVHGPFWNKVGVNVSEPFKHIYRSDQRWADPDIAPGPQVSLAVSL